jgi:2-keto-3-deoxy-L-rhamnonate aldolase RhmA
VSATAGLRDCGADRKCCRSPEYNEIVGHAAVDAVIIGPYDLSGSLGIPGQIEAPQVVDGISRVQNLCREHRKPCGIFAGTTEKAALYAQMGFDLIAVGMDCSVLLSGFRALHEAIRRTV